MSDKMWYDESLEDMYADAENETSELETELTDMLGHTPDALDVLDSANLIAYRGEFNGFTEMVFSDGRVIRYSHLDNAYTLVEENTDQDQFMLDNPTDWSDVSDADEILRWLDSIR